MKNLIKQWPILIGVGVFFFALATPVRAQLTCNISQVAPGALEISWVDAAANDGYAVAGAPGLFANSWRYAGDVDQWPTSALNWPLSAQGLDDQYFRVEKAPRGNLVSATLEQTYTTFAIGLLLSFADISGITPVHDVGVYTVTYETFDARGLSTTATGALCIPLGPTAAPVVSYQHGTVYLKTDVPSYGSTEQNVGIALASEGYITVMPDYLGMGDSPGMHPYVHARSQAVASVDLLRACYTFLAGTALAPSGDLFICGYSQGGHATLALQRELELNHAVEFPLTASAPMAGPHDLSGTMKDLILSDTVYDSPGYVAYILFGYNSVYNLFDDASEILAAPYDTTLPPLMDGTHSSSQINAAMPSMPKQIFTPAFLADFSANPDNPFRRALAANDTYHWLPTAPTTFYHCAADTTVPKLNSDVAVADMVNRGATQVTLVDPAPTANHSDGAIPSFLAAKAWFDSFLVP